MRGHPLDIRGFKPGAGAHSQMPRQPQCMSHQALAGVAQNVNVLEVQVHVERVIEAEHLRAQGDDLIGLFRRQRVPGTTQISICVRIQSVMS